jgi:hypothetical protein
MIRTYHLSLYVVFSLKQGIVVGVIADSGVKHHNPNPLMFLSETTPMTSY